MSILGWVLVWCGYGLNNNNNNCLKSNIQCIEIRVQWTVDFGAEINKELSFRYAIISSR